MHEACGYVRVTLLRRPRPSRVLRQRPARVSAAIRLRQWRAVTGSHAASDSAHYPQNIKKLTGAFGSDQPT
jgi:hypothetical protein